MENYREKLVKGTSFLLLMTALASLIGYAIRLFLSHNLPKEQFGLFYSVLAFAGMTIIFYDFGLTNGLVRFTSFYKAKKKYDKIKESLVIALLARVSFSIITFLIVFFFSNKISNVFLHTNASNILIILMLASIISVIYNIFLAYTQGMGFVYIYSSGEFLRNLITFLFIIFLIKFNLIGIVYSYLISSIIVSIIFVIISIKKSPYVFSQKIKIEIPFLKELFVYSIPIFLSGFGGIIISYTDTLMISYFKGLEQVAYYQVAMPTSRILWMFVGSITPILFPIITEMFSLNKRNLMKNTFNIISRIVMFVSVPTSVLMFSYPTIIIRILFGEKFIAASPVLRILSFVAIFYSLSMIISSFIAAEGNTKKISKIIFLSAVFNFFANLLLIPKIGMIGAAIASLASYILEFYLFSREAKSMHLPSNYSILLKFLILGIFFAITIYLLKAIINANPYVEMIIVLSISTILYIYLVIKSKALSSEEISIFKELFRKLFNS